MTIDSDMVKAMKAAVTPDEVAEVAKRVGLPEARVREIGRSERMAALGLKAPHRWTKNEDRALLRAKTAEEARAVARRIGVPEHRAVLRRQELRIDRGVTRDRHVWTDEEHRELRALETSGEVRAWAEERGLSVNTARNKWHLFRAHW